MHVLTNDRSADAVPVRAPRLPRSYLLSVLAAIGVAFLASLCCIGPLLFVTLGVGAGLASHFEPLRPLFAVLTLALLGLGFYTVYGRKSARPHGVATDTRTGVCSVDVSCVVRRNRTRDKVVLWVATIMAVVVLTFPQWSLLFV